MISEAKLMRNTTGTAHAHFLVLVGARDPQRSLEICDGDDGDDGEDALLSGRDV